VARKNKLELMVNDKEKAVILSASKMEEKSVAAFMRDAIINKAMKVKK